MKDESKFFGINLRNLLRKNNIRNIDLANELGLSKGAISNYVSGDYFPKIDIVVKIADFFGVSFEELISNPEASPSFTLHENDAYVCKIPVFHNVLVSEDVIYRPDNFIGSITAPIFLPNDSDYHAVYINDDSMNIFGIVCGNVVIFDSNTTPNNGDLAAVFYKKKKRIFIRKLFFENKNIKLCYNNSYDEYCSTKPNQEIVVLGKVVYATFNPNAK